MLLITRFIIVKVLLKLLKIKKIFDFLSVYIFKCKSTDIYVGSSISFYSGVVSYFIPSILHAANRRVLHYFVKNGFNDIVLTLHIIHPDSSLTSLELEQYFINTLQPNLNVDKFSNSTGFHEPISQYWRDY